MRIVNLTLMSGTLVCLSGCGRNETSVPKDVISAVEACVAAADAPGCADLYASDAEISEVGGMQVTGRDSILQFYQSQITPDLAMFSKATTNIADGNLGVVQGTYRVRNLKLGTFIEDGEFVNVYRKEGGAWKVYRSTFTSHRSVKGEVEVEPAQ
jgi:ketosteroid isomerase-like protein